ncbi:hypothetical protein EJ08DRAFT_733872 [Tothia fuscella]|uniref:AA1-like domain-containing protein n=1 Tax=Tothia fuscella TaxID=1048955 RepID=A0A9P4NSH9_9PEZI|nr:hypothetical protein EJ08DRAFT_733872 [Tothia fuscella]
MRAFFLFLPFLASTFASKQFQTGYWEVSELFSYLSTPDGKEGGIIFNITDANAVVEDWNVNVMCTYRWGPEGPRDGHDCPIPGKGSYPYWTFSVDNYENKGNFTLKVQHRFLDPDLGAPQSDGSYWQARTFGEIPFLEGTNLTCSKYNCDLTGSPTTTARIPILSAIG